MRNILTICLFAVQLISAQTVVRGPYLQVKTHNSIQICWRTDIPSSSRVNYGTQSGVFSQMVVDSSLKTNHFIQISNLAADTRYYYQIGTSTQVLENRVNQHFTTAVSPGTVKPFRFWAIGDFGKGNQGQRDVYQSFLQHTSTKETDLLIMLGDNAYPDGTDQQYQQYVFQVYDSLFRYLPFVSTPGNHDYNSVNRFDPPTQHTGPYYDILNFPTQGQMGGLASNTELYYSFDYGNVHFVCLNSELQAWTSSSNSTMLNWLRQDLQTNNKEWIICYFHQPPYSRGSHNSDDIWELLMLAMRQNVLPILEQYDVDLVLSGHSHVYERSKLIKGHYGFSFSFNNNTHTISNNSGNFNTGQHYTKYLNGTNDGTIYVVCGNSGSSENGASLNHPVMIASDGGSSAYGSLVIDVNGNRMDVSYLKSDGQIDDEFTIIKPDGSAPYTEVQEIAEANQPYIFPNPVNQTLYVNLELSAAEKLSWKIYDLSGRLILNGGNELAAGKQRLEIDMQSLEEQSYVLELLIAQKQYSFPFVKKKK
jgi:predicted MPP superfamily phosphohydrolase